MARMMTASAACLMFRADRANPGVCGHPAVRLVEIPELGGARVPCCAACGPGLVGAGANLDHVDVMPHDPLAPAAPVLTVPDRAPAGVLELSWAGAPARYTVELSVDAGASWRPAAVDVDDYSYPVDVRTVPDGTVALVRARARLSTAHGDLYGPWATSAPFTVGPPPPDPEPS